ncbi:MAG TPA: DinB family protein [Gemmatimonadales bacterium]|jgi:uncharacterized damage-inducible protein DinB|nr:DinB family protein [Gemmatimonadales bacterium]
MDARVAPLAMLYQLNTDLLLNCLDSLSDAEAQTRLEAGGNSITFLAAHLTDTRHFLTGRLEQPLFNPLARYLADVRSIEEIREWPSLEEIRSAWLGVSAHLQTVLSRLTVEDLVRSNVHRFPVEDTTTLGMIAFLVQHDSYHLGQVAFLRRQLGKPPMSYARRTPLAPA